MYNNSLTNTIRIKINKVACYSYFLDESVFSTDEILFLEEF